ncbi:MULTISPECIES: GntR family transcriptional regulator [unclassified Luteococcus]|uniref:GntR family transcriptional regulator n=1 Tax=unclassified Luteococcus TaxID=2639923 RepID=UPI00313B08B8
MGIAGSREQIVEELEAELARLPRGHRLPSEQQLMARFDVGRSTIRGVLAELEAHHLVRRVPGVGTFVHQRIRYPISPRRAPSFSEMVRAAGAEPRTVVLEHATAPVPARPAEALGLSQGDPAQHLQRLGHIDSEPACVFDEWFGPHVTVDLGLALRSFGSVGQVLQSSGFRPRRAVSRGTIRTAPEAVCRWLGVPPRTQTWFVVSTSVDADSEERLMHSQAWTRTDLVRMVFDVVPAPDGEDQP